jgi:hypothetical protein
VHHNLCQRRARATCRQRGDRSEQPASAAKGLTDRTSTFCGVMVGGASPVSVIANVASNSTLHNFGERWSRCLSSAAKPKETPAPAPQVLAWR